MMKKGDDMNPQYETLAINTGGVYYRGVNQTDAIFAAMQSGFESTVTMNGRLIASYSPISGMKYYTMEESK